VKLSASINKHLNAPSSSHFSAENRKKISDQATALAINHNILDREADLKLSDLYIHPSKTEKPPGPQP
jgi:hypothetical protein